ncbi:MAG: TlpA family protein disulfide reductase [Planctomycetia bacterium]|nr:TlpA family protein disulfide reductase [Planctomycetia bacterium]
MKRTPFLLLALCLAALAGDPPKDPKKAPPGGGKEKLFSGNVNAGNASPAGAEIAVGWSWTLDADNFLAKDPIVADAKGKFEKSMPWKDKKTVLAVDKAHRMGAAMEVKEGDLAKGVTFRLAPMVRVRMKVKSREEGFPTAGIAAGVKLEGAERVGTANVKETGIDMLLPPGAYRLEVRQEGWQPAEAKIQVPAGKAEWAAPELVVTPSLLAAKMGQPMPEWHIADAIGLPKDAKLAGLRGKWALLLFWREGCPSCRSWGIPNLVKFHEKHAAWRERLQIVAFHNKDAVNAKDLEDFLSKQEGMEWGLLALPFPVVIDSPAPSTVEEWGPGVFPYAVLIDAEGKLAGKGTLEEVEKRLEQEFK